MDLWFFFWPHTIIRKLHLLMKRFEFFTGEKLATFPCTTIFCGHNTDRFITQYAILSTENAFMENLSDGPSEKCKKKLSCQQNFKRKERNQNAHAHIVDTNALASTYSWGSEFLQMSSAIRTPSLLSGTTSSPIQCSNLKPTQNGMSLCEPKIVLTWFLNHKKFANT